MTDQYPVSDSVSEAKANHQLDTTGLICPEPVMLLHQAIRKAQAGETIEVIATDPATTRDIPNFCRHLGHELLAKTQTPANSLADDTTTENSPDEDIIYKYLVQKKQG